MARVDGEPGRVKQVVLSPLDRRSFPRSTVSASAAHISAISDRVISGNLVRQVNAARGAGPTTKRRYRFPGGRHAQRAH